MDIISNVFMGDNTFRFHIIFMNILPYYIYIVLYEHTIIKSVSFPFLISMRKTIIIDNTRERKRETKTNHSLQLTVQNKE